MHLSRNSKITITLPTLIVLLSAAGGAPSKRAHGNEIHAAIGVTHGAESLCRARMELYRARLNLARWRLRQLGTLHGHGHASWLEVSRARISVRRLHAHLDSKQRSLTFLCKLRTISWPQRRNGQPHEDFQFEKSVRQPCRVHRLDFNPPIALRSASWVATAPLAAMILRVTASALHSAQDHQWQTLPQAGNIRKEIADLELRIKRLKKIVDRADVAVELNRARLQLAIARARLRVSEAVHKSLARRGLCSACKTGLLLSISDAMHDPVTCAQASDGIRNRASFSHAVHSSALPSPIQASLELAAAKARAQGPLRMANAMLDYQTIRMHAARELYANGCGTEHDVHKAEQRVEDARIYVDHVRAMQQRHRKAYKQLQQKQRATPLRTSSPVVTADDCLSIDDACAIRSLIYLEDARLTMRAEHLGWQAEASALRELLQRLAATGKAHVSAIRERSLARARVALAEAYALACLEQEEIFKLEQQRILESSRGHPLSDPPAARTPFTILHKDDSPGFFSIAWPHFWTLRQCLPAPFRGFGQAAPSFFRRTMPTLPCRPTIDSTPASFTHAWTLVGSRRGFRRLPTAACIAILDESPGARPWLIRRFGQVLDVWGRPRSNSDACCPVPWHRRVAGRHGRATICSDTPRRWPVCRTSASLFANPSPRHQRPTERKQ